jgi:molybdate transport repressor ModE-like protein
VAARPEPPRPVAYKELTLVQMRSFAAVARLGSLSGAARSLGLAQPTVWKQVRALEAAFAAGLVEPHARGCRLTAEGRALDALVRPILSEVDALGRRYEEALSRREPEIRVAATPRIIDEDLPACVAAFQKAWPRAKIVLRTAIDEEVALVVARGECDLGYTEHGGPELEAGRLSWEMSYELDVLLLAPRGHPLSRRERVTPAMLGRYPMVTAPDAVCDPAVRAALQKHRVFSTPARVNAFMAAGIRRYVELGFGIGVIGGLLTPALRRSLAAQGLSARSMSRWFGRIAIDCLRRPGGYAHESHRAFARLVRRTMARLPREGVS